MSDEEQRLARQRQRDCYMLQQTYQDAARSWRWSRVELRGEKEKREEETLQRARKEQK